MVLIFFATGFEEIEALATVDILRRANIEVRMIGVGGDVITGGHGIQVRMDMVLEAIESLENIEMLVLPGGVPGIHNLKNSNALELLFKKGFEKNLFIAAICAAPSVLYDWGLINQKKVTAYPNYLEQLINCTQLNKDVVVDGKLITGRGVGVALEFGLQLVNQLKGAILTDELRRKMVMPTSESR